MGEEGLAVVAELLALRVVVLALDDAPPVLDADRHVVPVLVPRLLEGKQRLRVANEDLNAEPKGCVGWEVEIMTKPGYDDRSEAG